MVTNLKALQVADNPLIYPPKKIVQQGTKMIKNFLKEQYEVECAMKVEAERQALELQKHLKNECTEEQQEEKLIKVHEEVSGNFSLDKASRQNFSSSVFSLGNLYMRLLTQFFMLQLTSSLIQIRKTLKLTRQRSIGNKNCLTQMD